MATFEPTEEEKAAASYLDWDDAELGKFAKYIALTLATKGKDAEGLHRISAASCAMMLISQCHDSNAGEMIIKLDGHTHGKIPTGDWTVTVKQRAKPKKQPR